MEASDWIELGSAIASIILSIILGIGIQRRLTDRRNLKDYFISEVKTIQDSYCSILKDIQDDNLNPKTVQAEFKQINIKVTGIMYHLNIKQGIPTNLLISFQRDLLDKITSNTDFVQQYQSGSPVRFSDQSKIDFLRWRQINEKLFYNLIVKINEERIK